MSNLNFWRQLDVFDPAQFQRTVHVVGCGAIGSHVVDTLINTGIDRIVVYDFDHVEEHNIPNQAFLPEHVGMPKVAAMADLASKLGVQIEVVQQKVERLQINSPAYVIMAVDSMEARKAIWDSSCKYNPNVRLLETRMAAEYGIIHAINPLDATEIRFWESRWFPSDEAEESACTNRAVATTAKTLASLQVHYLIGWEAGEKPPAHTLFSLRPLTVQTSDARRLVA